MSLTAGPEVAGLGRYGYMQSVPFRFPRLTPTVKKLLILLAGAYVATAVVQNLAHFPIFQILSLEVGTSAQRVAWAWQPLTYWLTFVPVPDALLSFALELLGLYFFLAPFEEAFGPKRAIQLAVAGVVAYALAGIALSVLLLPLEMGPITHPLYGAAGIGLAAFGAFPVVAGNREILLMFVVPVKAWTAILIGFAVAAMLSLLGRDPFILATWAAAIGAGVGYAKWLTRPRSPRPKKARPKRGGNLRVVRGGDDDRPRYLN